MNYIIVILLILLFFLLYTTNLNTETFISSGIRHVTLNRFGTIDSVDVAPPSYRGVGPCYPTMCPKIYDENDTVCWRCVSREAEPQNE